jgi:lambda family phage portal protein
MRIVPAIRAAWREMKTVQRGSAYDGASVNRILLDWIAQAKSADDEIKGDLQMLRARARELGRNNSYAKRFFKLLVTNVIGPMGLQLQGRVRLPDGTFNKAVNTALQEAWTEWAEGPVTVDGKLTLNQCEQLGLKTWACDGEMLVRFHRAHPVNRFGLAIQFIDADLLDHRFNRTARPDANEIRMGVEVRKDGTPVGYWFWDKTTSAPVAVNRKRYFVPADEIVHLYKQDRVNQTRGVTWMHSVMVPAHMLDGYEQSEAVAARVAAAKMGFLVKKGDGPNITDDTKKPMTMEASPGTIEALIPGWEFEGWEPNHPSGQFGNFVKQMLRKVASGLSVGYNVLANDAEGVTYSTMRAFALIERDDWRTIQQDWNSGWRRTLYYQWLRMALLTGALVLPTSNPAHYMAVKHRPRGWPWVDPEKEAKAAGLLLGLGLVSRRAILAERGEDVEEVFRELAEEHELAAELGISISTDAPDDEKMTKEEWESQKEEGGGNGADRSGDATVTGFAHAA